MKRGMRIINCNFREFLKLTEKSQVYAFGSGKILERYKELSERITAVIDNNEKKQGMELLLGDKKIPVISFAQFLNRKNLDTEVLITSRFFEEMIEQMDAQELLAGMRCYIGLFMEYNYSEQQYSLNTSDIKIPAKIHYCWFGKEKIPSHLEKYMDSWKYYCPNYEIKRWDESNYDITKNRYMQEAYQCKKWGFVSDYARVDVVYQEGGIYLDTDVELIKNLDDLRRNEMFCGFQSRKYINFGLGFGAIKNHEILKCILEKYKNLDFIKPDASFNMIPCPHYQTEAMKQYGFSDNGMLQNIKNVTAYPQEFFSPISSYRNLGEVTKSTYSIHHYEGSWGTNNQLEQRLDIEKGIEKIKYRMEKM